MSNRTAARGPGSNQHKDQPPVAPRDAQTGGATTATFDADADPMAQYAPLPERRAIGGAATIEEIADPSGYRFRVVSTDDGSWTDLNDHINEGGGLESGGAYGVLPDTNRPYVKVHTHDDALRAAGAMAELTSPPAWKGLVRIYEHDPAEGWSNPFDVSGTIYNPNDHRDSTYDRQDKVIEVLKGDGGVPSDVTFDSESGGFHAYAETRESAEKVAEAVAKACSDFHNPKHEQAKRVLMDAALNDGPMPADPDLANEVDYLKREAAQAAKDAVKHALDRRAEYGYLG